MCEYDFVHPKAQWKPTQQTQHPIQILNVETYINPNTFVSNDLYFNLNNNMFAWEQCICPRIYIRTELLSSALKAKDENGKQTNINW